LGENELESIYKSIDSEIDSAWNLAVSDPYPKKEDLLRTVYKEVHK
jgi:TPP-dependent pyruvate/acetoin dehydrogenase alpha subunit